MNLAKTSDFMDDNDDNDHSKIGSGSRIATILKMLEMEIMARNREEEEPEPPQPEPLDGMEQLKAFFSGEEGLQRSNSFIKFANLLTEGD